MDFFQSIFDFFETGIYEFTREVMAWLSYKIVVWKITSMLFMIDVAHSTMILLMEDLSISEHLQSALSSLPNNVVNWMNFFNIFTGLGYVFQAWGTKLVLRVIGI